MKNDQRLKITPNAAGIELKLVKNHEEYFSSSYHNNFDTYKSYLEYRPLIFMELQFNIGEAVRCLTIEANTAVITLTNYMLERLLKLALIEDEMQLKPLTHPWQDCWDRMYPYFDWDMHKTINQSASRQLISGEQKKQLLKYKDVFRNGFSHAATDLIFKDYPETFTTPFHEGMGDVTHNLKKDPRNQLAFLQKIANENAHPYFKYVFDLISCIEENLQKKYPGNLVLIPLENGDFVRLSAKGWQKKLQLVIGVPKDNHAAIEIIESIVSHVEAELEKKEDEENAIFDIVFKTMNAYDEFKKSIKPYFPDTKL
jgi:hypothetical protein